MSFFSRDRRRLEARIDTLFCPRCRASLARRAIYYRRTRIDVFCPCGQMVTFTAPALRGDIFIEGGDS